MALLTSLNEEQKQAILHGEGPLLIIAGAGTGKTTVVTERIKHLLLEKGVNPSDILALTFTEKAAREMEERVDIALPYGYTQMWISTFHAFCDRIMKEEAINIGLDPAFKLATEAESIMFMRKNLYQFDLTYFRPLGNPNKFVQGMLQHFSRLKDDDITPEQYIMYAEKKAAANDLDPIELKKIHELAHAFERYETLKAKEGLMDFSDLISNVLKLFRERPHILKQYQNKFKFILVDEFQDTNFAQNELAILLSGSQQNITVVGDDDQSIYKWRGAALSNILQFKEHFPKAATVTLNRNYRSVQKVLDTSYQLIQHNNPDRLEIKENIDKHLIAMRGIPGDPVEFLFGPRVENEADLVIEKIHELMKKKSFTYKDFAILIRANDHAQPFVRAMERAQIPFQFLGPGHLFHQEEIKDLIAYLKVLYNFEDSASLYRVITNPIYELEARDIAAILNYAKKRNFTLFEALEQISDTFLSDEVKERATKIVTMINNHLKRVPHDTAGQVLYYYFEDSGLLEKFINPESVMGEKRAQNIAKFFEKLKSYESQHTDSSIFAIVDWIDLSMTLGESPLAADVDWSENNAVNILTIHSSKGLEFPVVFVVNLVSLRFPTRERREQIPLPDDLIREVLPESDQNLAEERRLFYVAMTRAKDNLFLTAANYYGEGKRERKISPFVIETLGEENVAAIMAKRKAETSVQQLSLMDVLEKTVTTEKKDAMASTVPQGGTMYPVTYLSYSQIQTYETCPLHYKLRYILKIPPFPTAPLSFGISVHNVMKDYYDAVIKGQQPSLQNIDSLLKKQWLNEGYQSKSHMETAFKQARFMIEKYITDHPAIQPLATEIPFQFAIPGLKVGGRIDRVDRLPDGRIEIVDYKTGATVPTEKKVLTDLQLTIYALAATSVHDEIFNKPAEEIVLSLYYLEPGIKFTTTRTKEQLEEAKETLRQKAEEISHSTFTCTVMSCKTCEYKMLCQTYAG